MKSALAGRKVRCPRCGSLVRIPNLPDSEGASAEPADETHAAKSSGDDAPVIPRLTRKERARSFRSPDEVRVARTRFVRRWLGLVMLGAAILGVAIFSPQVGFPVSAIAGLISGILLGIGCIGICVRVLMNDRQKYFWMLSSGNYRRSLTHEEYEALQAGVRPFLVLASRAALVCGCSLIGVYVAHAQLGATGGEPAVAQSAPAPNARATKPVAAAPDEVQPIQAIITTAQPANLATQPKKSQDGRSGNSERPKDPFRLEPKKLEGASPKGNADPTPPSTTNPFRSEAKTPQDGRPAVSGNARTPSSPRVQAPPPAEPARNGHPPGTAARSGPYTASSPPEVGDVVTLFDGARRRVARVTSVDVAVKKCDVQIIEASPFDLRGEIVETNEKTTVSFGQMRRHKLSAKAGKPQQGLAPGL